VSEIRELKLKYNRIHGYIEKSGFFEELYKTKEYQSCDEELQKIIDHLFWKLKHYKDCSYSIEGHKKDKEEIERLNSELSYHHDTIKDLNSTNAYLRNCICANTVKLEEYESILSSYNSENGYPLKLYKRKNKPVEISYGGEAFKVIKKELLCAIGGFCTLVGTIGLILVLTLYPLLNFFYLLFIPLALICAAPFFITFILMQRAKRPKLKNGRIFIDPINTEKDLKEKLKGFKSRIKIWEHGIQEKKEQLLDQVNKLEKELAETEKEE